MLDIYDELADTLLEAWCELQRKQQARNAPVPPLDSLTGYDVKLSDAGEPAIQ